VSGQWRIHWRKGTIERRVKKSKFASHLSHFLSMDLLQAQQEVPELLISPLAEVVQVMIIIDRMM